MQAGSKQVQSAQGSPKQAVLSTFCIAAPNPATAAQLSREKPGNPQVNGAPRGQEKAVHTQLQNTGALSRGGRGLRIQLPGMGLEGPLGEGRFKYVAHSSNSAIRALPSKHRYQTQVGGEISLYPHRRHPEGPVLAAPLLFHQHLMNRAGGWVKKHTSHALP